MEICTRCSKNVAEVRLDIKRLDNPDKALHGLLCGQCIEEVIHFLYSCTCHIKEKENERIHTG